MVGAVARKSSAFQGLTNVAFEVEQGYGPSPALEHLGLAPDLGKPAAGLGVDRGRVEVRLVFVQDHVQHHFLVTPEGLLKAKVF